MDKTCIECGEHNCRVVKGLCVKCYNHRYYKKNKDSIKEYQKKNAKKIKIWNKKWHEQNHNEIKIRRDNRNRERGLLPMSENRGCAIFLGIHVAERVLSKVFKNVEIQPHGNPGFDFICNKGMKIDVKSSCIRINKNINYWNFHIDKNKIADYFLCLAFDNRNDLNPLHMWLLPADKFNNKTGAGILVNKINKWDKCALDINKVSVCCDVIKGVHT